MKFYGSFGTWLKQRRKALDLTQAELADHVCCSVELIRKIERDERRPSKQIVERLADVLAIAADARAEFVTFARRTETVSPAPSLHSPASTARHNLPPQLTTFIGRVDELAQIIDRLADPACRLLTLVGSGGIGKTRLVLAAAAQIAEFGSRVYFVALVGVDAPDLVPSAMAVALGISFYGPQAPAVQIVTYLQDKALLLVLDNFEHLLDATGLLTAILAAAPAVKILATSRERLNLQEEWVITVEGLPFPQEGVTDAVENYSAVQLFVWRAQQTQANFSLDQNAEVVLSICRYVEGLPLGLELAASWLRGMSCRQIAARMEHSLDFLVTPVRNVPERHRSLRAVFEQSWRQLSDTEQRVLAALSVFRGGFDLEAAEQVAGASPAVLVRLADKSLVRFNASDRYDLHELLRQFAADKLAETGETAAIARCHLEYFLRLAELTANRYYPQKADRLEIEHDNINTAFAWSLSDDKVEAGLSLAGAMHFFWADRMYFHEGATWLDRLLVRGNDAPASVHARGLLVAGEMAAGFDDFERARVYEEDSLRLARAAGDKWCTAWALGNLGFHVAPYNDHSRALLEQALALFREIGDGIAMSHMLGRLASTLVTQGDYDRARGLAEEGLALTRSAKDIAATASALLKLAEVGWVQNHDPGQALLLLEESLSLARETRNRFLVAWLPCCIGQAAYAQGDYGHAQARYAESLAIFQELGCHERLAAADLFGFGELAGVQGRPERAARLFGAAVAFAKAIEKLPLESAHAERAISTVRGQLSAAACAAAWAEGQAMTSEQAIAYALEAS